MSEEGKRNGACDQEGDQEQPQGAAQQGAGNGKGSGKELRNGIIIALFTAIVTGAVTAAGSYWLVDWRLGKEHEYWFQELEARLPKEHQYWIDKQEHLRAIRIMDAQLALVKDLTQDLGGLQGLRWRINQHIIHYLALEMLADRHGRDYAKDLRAMEEKEISGLRVQLEAKYNKCQGHFMMAQMLFESLKKKPSGDVKGPLYAFGEYVQSADYVVDATMAPKVKIALAVQPQLAGKPNPESVEALVHEYTMTTITPGHRRFTELTNDLLRLLAKEIAVKGE